MNTIEGAPVDQMLFNPVSFSIFSVVSVAHFCHQSGIPSVRIKMTWDYTSILGWDGCIDTLEMKNSIPSIPTSDLRDLGTHETLAVLMSF